MSVTSWSELILIASAVGGAIGWLIEFHSDRRRDSRELGKIDVETFGKMGEQIDRLESKVVKLREANDQLQNRVEALEALLDTKEPAIKAKDKSIAELAAQVDSLNTRLNRVVIYLSGFLKELDDKKIQYTPPQQWLYGLSSGSTTVRATASGYAAGAIPVLD